MSIQRTVSGIVDYLLAKVEQIDDRDDIDIEKKTKYELGLLREARGFCGLELAYKKLVMQAPDIAKDKTIVLQIGTPPKPAPVPNGTPVIEEAKAAQGQ